MAEIAWPDGLFPYKTMFFLQPHIGGQESPLTRRRKVYGLSAPRWVARLTFRAGHGYDGDNLYRGLGPSAGDAAFYAGRLDALIAQLQGGLHVVRFHDFRRPKPQSYLTSYTPPMTLDGAAEAGASTIVIQRGHGEIGPSIGDYIGGDGRPHIVTDVSPRSGSMQSAGGPDGKITVTFEPPLSAPIAAAAPLEVEMITAPFRLVNEDDGANEGEVGQPIEYVLDFVEELP